MRCSSLGTLLPGPLRRRRGTGTWTVNRDFCSVIPFAEDRRGSFVAVLENDDSDGARTFPTIRHPRSVCSRSRDQRVDRVELSKSITQVDTLAP
jgi:hypothetical protein